MNLYLTNQYAEREAHKLKLKQTDANGAAFQAILLETEKGLGFSNVTENFRYFRSRINADNFGTILEGLQRLIFVEISLERGKDDPQRIFESLNSTGLDLTQSDLIRNFILMDLEPAEQQRLFARIWNPIEENARDLTRQKSLVSDFIRDYLTLRNKKIPNKSKVYHEFKKRYPHKQDSVYMQDLEDMKSLAMHYRKFVNPEVEEDVAIRRALLRIKTLEINVVYPFLLQLFEDVENGRLETPQLLEILKLVQSYVWRRFIVGLPTNALNKVFMTLYADVDTEEYYDSVAVALLKKRGNSRFPTDEEVRNALQDRDLYNIKNKNRNYLFELLENHNNREFVDTNNEHITVEHIFPRTPHEAWREDLSEESYLLFSQKYLHTIANLTLSGNNGALGNKRFQEKKHMNTKGGEQGYQYSRLWLNQYLKEIDHWDVDTYKRRLQLIIERFLDIWPSPQVDLPTAEQTEEQNIFEAESPRNRKLEYFIFEDTKVEQYHVAQIYFHVIAKLFEQNPQLILAQGEILKISQNPNEFRTPQELTNGYFIESNIDSSSKFRVLKKLLTRFDLEEELLIKYATPEDKTAPSRFSLRRRYWRQLLPLIEGTELFANVNPTKDHWLSTGAGVSGLSFTFVIANTFARLELTIGSSDKSRNKRYFDQLFGRKSAIEAVFGHPLGWERLSDKKMSRIKYQNDGLSLAREEDWPAMNDFFITHLPTFERALKNEIRMLK